MVTQIILVDRDNRQWPITVKLFARHPRASSAMLSTHLDLSESQTFGVYIYQCRLIT